MAKDRQIWVVATRQLCVGERVHVAPPSASISRAKSYAFQLPLLACKTLHRNGSIRPAFGEDAEALREIGAPCRAFYATRRAPHVDAEAEQAPREPLRTDEGAEALRGDVVELVREEMAVGLKASYVKALEAIGLDPGDYRNNGERRDALAAWLEANAQ